LAAEGGRGEGFALVILDGHMPSMDGFEVARRIRGTPELAGATIMMLTSGSQLGDVARCRELGIASSLVKPVAQSKLLSAVRQALAGRPAAVRSAPAPIPAAATSEPAELAGRRLRVLVAEDNAVNLMVVMRLLDKRGDEAVVAENGAKAVDAVRQGRFDLVLMDVQMPVMGGFEATAKIRELEHETGGHLPIVGVTAHALKGDEERCLAAGMDAYVSKPVKADALWAAMAKALMSSEPAVASPSIENDGHRAPDLDEELADLDQDAALANACDDSVLLGRIVRSWLDEAPGRLQAMRAELGRRDTTALEQSAHAVRGSLMLLGALRAAAMAQTLETAASCGRLRELEPALTSLETEIARLAPQFERIVADRRAA
jgi:CheY-like chemotaxis protein